MYCFHFLQRLMYTSVCLVLSLECYNCKLRPFSHYRKALAPRRKPYRIGFLYVHTNGDFGAISVSVTKRSRASKILNVDLYISDRSPPPLDFRCSVNKYSDRTERKWVGARAGTHWHAINIQPWVKIGILWAPSPLGPLLGPRDVWTTCSSCLLLPFILYWTVFHVDTKRYPVKCWRGLIIVQRLWSY